MSKKYIYYFTSIFTILFNIKPLARVIAMFLGQKPAQPEFIELARSGVQFRVRSAMDIWSVKETLLDHFYEKFGFPISKGWSIIDIGGGIGDFSVLAAEKYAENKVFIFEPTPASFALLSENLHANKVTNAQCFPNGVWSKDGEIVIDTNVGEAVQFTSQALGQGDQSIAGKVIVQSFSLETVFSKTGVSNCDLMKLDCEGAEYEILFKAPDSVLMRIDRIVMEYHDNAGEFTHEDMARFLTGKGYRVDVFPNDVHPYLGYLRAAR